MFRLSAAVISFFCLANAYKIAIFVPDISNSQLIWNARVGETLANAGHNVTLIRLKMLALRAVPLKARGDINEWTFDARRDADYEEVSEVLGNVFEDFEIWSSTFQKMLRTLGGLVARACEVIVQDKEFLERLRAAKFDIAFSDMAGLCSTGLIHYARIPAWIFMNNAPLVDAYASILGVPSPPSYVPPVMSASSDEMTFFERFKSFVAWSAFPILFRMVNAGPTTALFRKHVDPDFPSLEDLVRDCPIVMVNSDEMYMLPRPTLHKIVNVAGIGMRTEDAKPLTGEFAKIAESTSKMVVFSLGSVANSSMMPVSWKKALMDSFRKFPDVQFIMRYELSDMDSFKPPNVHTFKWIPQSDLLHHPKTRVLMSHGGVNSIQEAIASAKPVVAIPLFADQSANAKVAQKRGFAEILLKSNFTVHSVTDALTSLLHDQRYTKSVERLRAMIRKKPVKAEELLVRWTEFVAEFRTLPNLIPHGTHLSTVEYLCLDVVAVLLLALSLLIAVILFAVRRCCRFVYAKLRPPKQKTA